MEGKHLEIIVCSHIEKLKKEFSELIKTSDRYFGEAERRLNYFDQIVDDRHLEFELGKFVLFLAHIYEEITRLWAKTVFLVGIDIRESDLLDYPFAYSWVNEFAKIIVTNDRLKFEEHILNFSLEHIDNLLELLSLFQVKNNIPIEEYLLDQLAVTLSAAQQLVETSEKDDYPIYIDPVELKEWVESGIEAREHIFTETIDLLLDRQRIFYQAKYEPSLQNMSDQMLLNEIERIIAFELNRKII